MKKVSYLILMVILLIPITVRGKPISVHLKLNESMQEQSISQSFMRRGLYMLSRIYIQL